MQLNRRVLAADDEVAVLRLYQSSLVGEVREARLNDLYAMVDVVVEEAGSDDQSGEKIELTTVESGQAAVDAVRQATEAGVPYAVALLDIRMPPGIDGMETAVQLRKIDPSIHIVIVSAYSDYSPDEVRDALRHNMLFYHKPFQQAEIRQVVYNACISWDRDAELCEMRASLEQQVEERTRKIHRLAQMQQYQAFRSGMEEMSISVMHEIGNALTAALVMAREIGRRTNKGLETIEKIVKAQAKMEGAQLQQLQMESMQWVKEELMEAQQQDLSEVIQGLLTIQDVVRYHQRRGTKANRMDELRTLHLGELLGDLQLVLLPQLENQQVELKLIGHPELGQSCHCRLTPYHFVQMMIRLIEYLLEQIEKAPHAHTPVITMDVIRRPHRTHLQISWPGSKNLYDEECQQLFRHPSLDFVSNLLKKVDGDMCCYQGFLILLPDHVEQTGPPGDAAGE